MNPSDERTPLVASTSENFDYTLSDINTYTPKKTDNFSRDSWEFAGPGINVVHSNIFVDEDEYASRKAQQAKRALGAFFSTAIAGNDITSSCFYTIGLVIANAGVWSPVSLLLVVLVLCLYQGIYSEVGTALPLNGGTYNILLNTTNKLVASIAASLTILSYTATAVISADTSATYANLLYPKIPILPTTICILDFIALITWAGIGESAIVASILFCIHMSVLSVLVISSLATLIMLGPNILLEAWKLPSIRTVPLDIFYGFCIGLLGVSGFESSSNYIEEQAPKVFPKSLRNMTIAAGIFNPALAFFSIALIPMKYTLKPKNELLLLGCLANLSLGYWFEVVVSVDAILVLTGAVLTSFIGVTGLVRRMTLDRCLPQFLLSENRWRKTNHWIIFVFFLTTCSLLLTVRGSSVMLSGVYTVSFLSVLTLFGVGNLILKYKRSRLPRDHRAPVLLVLLALVMAIAALVGNLVFNIMYLVYFSIYFFVYLVVIVAMMTRTRIIIYMYRSPLRKLFGERLKGLFKKINQQEMIFFAKNDDISILNKAITYVRENEQTDCLRIVHVYRSEDEIPLRFRWNVTVLDEMYPKLRIDLCLVKGSFTPAMIEKLSELFNVPSNFMYITTPSDKFPYRISEMGGVRLITH